MCLTACGPGSILDRLRRGYFKGFSLADHTLPTHLEPAWHKMTQSHPDGTTQAADSEEEDLTTGFVFRI